ncbi:MAG: SCP2 sterol-binding domain-containing protein [Lachnospiraceae bacterium]|nr:SCP2 sterol-binding domain-containing protein [Lachnospiraceae bacterium]MBR3599812.1 SCP2 sterol-binding domain-containing protein [Lachnospiraceae bacterium]
MTYEEIVEKVRERLKDADTSKVDGFLAIQVNITEEGAGAFYVEVKDGKLSVEPYEYHDRQALITMKSKNFIKLMEGSLDPVAAFTLGKLKIDGSIEKVLEFGKLL